MCYGNTSKNKNVCKSCQDQNYSPPYVYPWYFVADSELELESTLQLVADRLVELDRQRRADGTHAPRFHLMTLLIRQNTMTPVI